MRLVVLCSELLAFVIAAVWTFRWSNDEFVRLSYLNSSILWSIISWSSLVVFVLRFVVVVVFSVKRFVLVLVVRFATRFVLLLFSSSVHDRYDSSSSSQPFNYDILFRIFIFG